MTRRLRPVTERILARLPGPRVLWIVAWALVPWLNAGANLLLETEARSAIWEQSRTLVLLNYAALSFAIVITLWGTERIARDHCHASGTENGHSHGLVDRSILRSHAGVRAVLVSLGVLAAAAVA